MNSLLLSIGAVAGTILIYAGAVKLHKRFDNPFTLPILLSTAVIILLLLILSIDYKIYMLGGEWISNLLGPAVVALAYPLYQNRHLIMNLTIPILFGTLIGAFTGVLTGVLLTKWAGFSEEIIMTISSKSVTTPVSMAISESLGGIPPLAAVFVMIAGISGGVFSPYLFKLLKLKHYVATGMALGSASHAVGTAAALERSELEGSISSVAMVISAVIVSVITPFLMRVFL